MNYTVRVGDEKFVIKNVKAGAGTVEFNGAPARVELYHIRGNLYSLHWNEEVFPVQIDATNQEVRVGPHIFEIQLEDERSTILKKFQQRAHSESSLVTIKAPMPGLIVRLEAKEGEFVKKGQGVVVVEAMKMENEIKAPLAGTITEIMVTRHMAVEKGAPLLQIKPEQA